jgi:hypothetical protein
MGLTIHYSGKLRNPGCLPTLLDETIDICQTLQWEYNVLERHDKFPIEGIMAAPEGSEPLWLTFLEDGTMCHPMIYEIDLEEHGGNLPPDAEHWLFTKTQYAGVDAHMAMIRLIRHLTEKYFERFELHDESQYWETGDEAKCRQIFEKYDFLMDMVGAALNGMDHIPNEPVDSLVGRIEKMLEEKFGMRKVE